MVIEKSARSRKYSPMSMQSRFLSLSSSKTSQIHAFCASFMCFFNPLSLLISLSLSTDLAILFRFWIGNIFLIIFHNITNCNMSFLESRSLLHHTNLAEHCGLLLRLGLFKHRCSPRYWWWWPAWPPSLLPLQSLSAQPCPSQSPG